MFGKGAVFIIVHSLECEFHTECAFALHIDGGHSHHPVWCEFGGFSCYNLLQYYDMSMCVHVYVHAHTCL